MNICKPDVGRDYLRHKEINSYLDYLGYRYNHFVSVITIGKTYEGRNLKAIKIDLYKNEDNKKNDTKLNNPNNNNNNNNINLKQKRYWILIEGGTHAREWISVTVALYCIYQLTERHCRNLDILRKIKFMIIPLVNADGYEYTHMKNRRWRKNRRPVLYSDQIGTDCNRNYDFHWDTGPTKSNKGTYRGDEPFSEPETCAVRDVLQKLGENLKFFLSLHAYAESIMYPWGYTKELPEKWKELHYIAECGKNAILKSTGRKYRCGSISTLTSRTFSGTIVDYAYGVQNIPYTLVMELPSAEIGFQPPREMIREIGNESWIGIKAMCERVLAFCNPTSSDLFNEKRKSSA